MTTRTEVPTILWEGASRTTYIYWVYPIGTSFKPEGGNYIFAKEDRPGHWTPVYIGQTSNLAERFEEHHKKWCIKQHGATHIHAHLNANERDRLTEEADLIKNWHPPCND